MNDRKIVRKAVFPVAGLGTRFLPATKASPKEMLPIVDKPLIQYAVEEAYAAGIREMIFVTGRNKRAIEDHFDTAYELEAELVASGKQELIELVNSIKPDDMECVYIRQAKALGLGHAVLCAEHLVAGQPFAVLLADDLMVGETPILKQMTERYKDTQSSIIAVQEVPWQHTNRYGIVSCPNLEGDLLDITALVEKPKPDVAPSNLGIAGRYILEPGVFDAIKKQNQGALGEIQLTDGLAGLLEHQKIFAFRYQGKRYDCGSKLGFLQATVALGLNHPELGSEFKLWLENRE